MEEDVTLGHYRLLGVLGRGGMGQVYLAEDMRLKRRVALKVLPAELAMDPERRLRFEREAETIAALDHPNIVTLYSIEEADGIHFLTMQLVSGRTLDKVIPAGGIDLDTFLPLATQLVDAVDAAHRKGIVHRDLKPGNIMVSDEGRLAVLDFGLAKTEPAGVLGQGGREDAPATRLTSAGQILGTVTYMSPEQAQGMEADARSDVFSLGAVLTEMLTARPPFQGDNRSAMISAILKDEPLAIDAERADLPPELARIVRRCLRKDPERRYQTVRDLANELAELKAQPAGGSGTAAVSVETPARPVPERRGRRRSVAAVLAVLALVVVLWALVQWLQYTPQDPDGAGGAIDSIVALPASIFGGPELAALADTVPRAISRGLGTIDGLQVGLPPTRAELEAVGNDPERLPGRSRPSAFVYSSVTAGGRDTVAINVQLVDTGTQRILWSDEYQGQRGMETELARLAAEGIREALAADAAATSVAGLAVSSEADTWLRQGMFYASRYDTLRLASDFDVALKAFDDALRAEPRLEAAAAEAAHLYLLADESGRPGALQAAEQWIHRLLEIDPQTSRVWSLRAEVEGRRDDGERSTRLRHALRGIAQRSGDPRAHDVLGRALAEAGYSAVLAMAAFRRAAELDWMYHQPRLREAMLLLAHGRTSEAQLRIDEVTRLEPGAPAAMVAQAAAHARSGRSEEAGRLLERLQGMVEAGRLPAAWIEPLRAPDAATADPDEALRNRAVGGALLPYDTLLLSAALESLRGDPGHAAAIAAARERFRELLSILDEADARGEPPAYLRREADALAARLGVTR